MLIAALAASLFVGAIATFGDFVWAHWHIRHQPLYGLLHGAAFCLAIGAAVGARTGRMVPALIAGPIVGIVAAGAFYALAPSLGMAAMFPAWMLFWICFALVQRQLTGESMAYTAVRGLAAALLSGIAFYLISGIWIGGEPAAPGYVRHFLSWTFAFFPGFASLFLGVATGRSDGRKRRPFR